MTRTEWFTLLGAMSTTGAAVLAGIALWKIRDERRRAFRLGLFVDLLKAMGEPRVDLQHNPRVQLLR